MNPASLTFVITGSRPGGWGDEDAACADYIEALLSGHQPDPEPIFERVRQSAPGRLFSDPTQPEFNPVDLDYCLRIDRFDFVMLVKQEEGLFIMKAIG
jgi:2-phosphosulfolactate phosphatase